MTQNQSRSTSSCTSSLRLFNKGKAHGNHSYDVDSTKTKANRVLDESGETFHVCYENTCHFPNESNRIQCPLIGAATIHSTSTSSIIRHSWRGYVVVKQSNVSQFALWHDQSTLQQRLKRHRNILSRPIHHRLPSTLVIAAARIVSCRQVCRCADPMSWLEAFPLQILRFRHHLTR